MRLSISRRWAVFTIASSLFILSQFYRASVAVITPQLIADLNLDTRGLSLMSAAFFYGFALTQIPIVVYLDHIGPRLSMTVLSLIAVIGALIFAWADSLSMLILGRLLLGIGMACNLMGTFKLITLWFSPLQFATLTALVFSLGTAGNIFATSPLVLLVQEFGWRVTFSLFAAITFLQTAGFFLIVRDRPAAAAQIAPPSQSPKKPAEIFSGLGQLFHQKDYWIISVGTFCRYGIYAAVQALWAGPYLMTARQLPALEAGNLIFLMNIGFILGGPFFGMLSDKVLNTRKWVVIIGLAGLASTMYVLAVLPPRAGLGLMSLLFLSLGVMSSAGGVMYTHIKELMPIEKAGSAMTGINFFTMVGSAVFLQGLGNLMQQLYPEASLGAEAFKGAFYLCTACLLAVTGLYVLTRDTSVKAGRQN